RSAEETATLHKHFEQGVKTLARFEVAEGGVYAIALSPNGERVAAAGGDGKVRLFDVKKSALASSFVPVEINKDAKANPIAVASADTKNTVEETRIRDSEPPIGAGDSVKKLFVEPAAIQMDSPSRY